MDSSNEEELMSLDSSDSDTDYFTNSYKNGKKPSKKYARKSTNESKELNTNPKFKRSDCDPPCKGIDHEILEIASVVPGTSIPQKVINGEGSSSEDNEDNSNICKPQASREAGEMEITLSDEESDGASNTLMASQPSSSGSGTFDGSPYTAAGYSLRRKRKINYEEIDNGPELDGKRYDSKSRQKKEILDIFSLSATKIAKYSQNPDLIDSYTKCKIVFMDGTDSSCLNSVVKFFETCGQQFESMFIQIRYDMENYTFLKNVLKNTPALSRLDYRYQSQNDALHFLKLLKDLTESSSLPSLASLRLIGVSGSESLREDHISTLMKIKARFQCLELGDSFWEDVKDTTIEKLLDTHKTCLETFIINGGFRGDAEKEKVLISLPKMEALKTLCICPKYTFLSEFKNPHSKKARVITLERFIKDEPFKIAIKFTCDLPKLQCLVLGNLIDIEGLVFSSVRKLAEFRCGSYWNLSISFPSEGSRKALMESTVTEFQFPDALKDPIFTVKVAKHFPNVKKVWLYLPSVPVLRAFFKAFENSKVEELYLKTQFDFEKTMESCLLPNMRDVLQKSPETETVVQTLKEYKHFDEYIRYYNVELPVEAEDLMESHSAGIEALKSLKVLHLEHIPRTLLIPIPDDERKWYDHNCKFMSQTFGYEDYPLNRKCHKEILKLNLSEYIWKHIQIQTTYTMDFHEAGFVDIPDEQVIREVRSHSEYSYDEEEEDIFFPVQKSTPKGAQIKIMPSMLLPSFKAKSEDA